MIAILTSLSMILTVFVSIMRRKRNDEERSEQDSYSEKLKQAIKPEEQHIYVSRAKNLIISDASAIDGKIKTESKAEIDALGRMLINLEDIKEFYTWSQKQAKSSFKLAVSMCIVGLGFNGSSHCSSYCI
jgi:hypothetical protein